MSELQVKVKEGILRGVQSKTDSGFSYFSFLGIPYGKPPVGELRFKPPLPAEPWTGIRDANSYGNECCQVQILSTRYCGNEDCLYLNVYTPRLTQNNTQQFPVVVYIHGGGYLNGSGNYGIFAPDLIVEQDIIIVTINYRLGVLGFLSLDIPEAIGNAGLRDQSLALRWVYNNISSFSGDVNNITMCGVSAGAASIELHMLSSMSKNLFHKAILQSGSALMPWSITRKPLEMAKRLVKQLGGQATEPKDMHDFLIKVNSEDLLRATFDMKTDADIKETQLFIFTPVIEKVFDSVESFLSKEPIEMIRNGDLMKIPTITGINSKEGLIFKNFYGKAVDNLRHRRFIDYVPEYLITDRDKDDERLRNIYKKSLEDQNQEDPINNFLSDLMIVGGVHVSLKYRKLQATNYYYFFTYDGNINFVKKVMNIREKGACHGDETTYLSKSFQVSEALAKPKDVMIRRRMTKMWANFVIHGNPTPEKNEDIKVKWMPVSQDKMYILEIGNDLIMRSNILSERTSLWEDFYNNLGGSSLITQNQG